MTRGAKGVSQKVILYDKMFKVPPPQKKCFCEDYLCFYVDLVIKLLFKFSCENSCVHRMCLLLTFPPWTIGGGSPVVICETVTLTDQVFVSLNREAHRQNSHKLCLCSCGMVLLPWCSCNSLFVKYAQSHSGHCYRLYKPCSTLFHWTVHQSTIHCCEINF